MPIKYSEQASWSINLRDSPEFSINLGVTFE